MIGARRHETVRVVLAHHFIMWRDLDGPHRGEWFCGCGLKFGFSDTAIDHQVAQVIEWLDRTGAMS